MIIETKRLLLRPFVPEDWPGLYAYLSQPETVRYEPYGVFTKEEAKAEAVQRANSEAFLAVCLKDTGKLIGNIYLCRQEYKTWELGFVFNALYRGQGYATEAAQAALQQYFATGEMRRVIAMCNPENTASWRLLERLGMKLEGRLVKNIWLKKDEQGNPIWQDTFLYGMIDNNK